MAGYSDIHGAAWDNFLGGFNGIGFDADNFAGADVKLIMQSYGKGLIASFGADVGRLAASDGAAFDAIASGIAETIRQIMPKEEQNNNGEVVSFSLSFENRGDHDVKISIDEQLPQGWIETATTGGEVSVAGRKYEIEVSPQATRYVDYLYRSGLGAGSYDVVTGLNAEWANGIGSNDAMTTAYVIENDISGLIEKLTGPSGLIGQRSMPDVEANLEMIKRRIGFDGSIGSDADINELIVWTLNAIDALPAYRSGNSDEIRFILCEMVENLGAMQALGALDASFSISVGDPNDPASYHGDTTSSIGAGGGGCAMMRDNRTNILIFLVLCILPVLIMYRLRGCL